MENGRGGLPFSLSILKFVFLFLVYLLNNIKINIDIVEIHDIIKAKGGDLYGKFGSPAVSVLRRTDAH